MNKAYCNYKLIFTNPIGAGTFEEAFTSQVVNQSIFIKENYIQIPATSLILTENDTTSSHKADVNKAIQNTSGITLFNVKDSSGNIVEVENDKIRATSQVYTIEYHLTFAWSSFGTLYSGQLNLIYTIVAVANRYPVKKWTVLDVINRACELIEPLSDGERPKFRLKGVDYTNPNSPTVEVGSEAEKYDKRLSPEFAFTKMHFREQMKQVGGFIHAEPRIKAVKTDSDGKEYYELSFDKYGGTGRATIKNRKPYMSRLFKTDINEYCTGLDSSSDNLINKLDYAQGVIAEPSYGGGYFGKSLRKETTNLRMEEDDGTFISTQFPIYEIKSLKTTYIPASGLESIVLDIKPYVFESADYQNLSSYKGIYPYAKSFALVYTQGEKNIKGLFFKNPDAVSPVFQNYSIKNILQEVYGGTVDIWAGTYPNIAVEIEYIPIYPARIKTNKSLVLNTRKRTIAYNQSSNLIETRYYGENLKGVVARLGNIEKTLTYKLAFMSDIPKAGMLYDDHYYISTVAVEILPKYIKCTIGLSKDFNRLSEYVGVNSEKRMWEVSEKQAIKRDSAISEYLLFTEKEQPDDSGCMLNVSPASLLNISGFAPETKRPISAAWFRTYSKNKTQLASFSLPVISSSFGDTMSFTSLVEDNYSAGQKLVEDTENGVVQGRYGENVPYGDYYGRFYWYKANLRGGIVGQGTSDRNLYPQGAVGGETETGELLTGFKKYRKDSREVPQWSFDIVAVKDDEDTIIGSALMRNSWLVNTEPKSMQLWVFPERLNTIDSAIDFTNATQLPINSYVAFAGRTITFTQYYNCAAWALVTERTERTETVEDEDGNTFDQTIYTGGELIIGQNKEISRQKIFMVKKKDIYV